MLIIKTISIFKLTMLLICLVPVMTQGATVRGKVHGQEGYIQGAMVTITSPDGLFTETVYSNGAGRFVLKTDQAGSVTIRVRKPYFRDITNTINISEKASGDLVFTMEAMTSEKEISDSLSASAHYARIQFDKPEHKQWFQVDCLTCHQLGNTYTRMPRPQQVWSQVLTRMLGFYGVTDSTWIEYYAGTLSKTFDNKPVKSNQAHTIDPMIFQSRILEWKLPQGFIAHDVEYNETDGKFYTVDQGNDQIYITDPGTNLTETFSIPDNGIPIGGKFKELLGVTNPFSLAVSRGPHSLQKGPDGHYYTTDTVSGQIGEFDPKKRSYIGHDIGGKALYPHTLRFDKRGRVWFTLGASNQVGSFDTKNRTMTLIDLPLDTDRQHMPALMPYGIDIHPIDGSVWYSSLMANRIGRIDAETLEVKIYTPPLIGPRRMRFDAEGSLWIPGFGTGTLVKLDTQTMKYTTYPIPALAENEIEAPYAVGVHPDTQEVWITANMSDRMFRFLPKEERFIAYPLPTRGTYLRDIIFTPQGWVCAASSPVPAALTVEGGMQGIICLEPYSAQTTVVRREK